MQVYYNKSSLKKHIRLHHGQYYDGKTADGLKEDLDLAALRRFHESITESGQQVATIQPPDGVPPAGVHAQQQVVVQAELPSHMAVVPEVVPPAATVGVPGSVLQL